MNLVLFRRVVSAALLAGTFGGLMLTGLQRWRIEGLIDQAERHEQAAAHPAAQAGADASHRGAANEHETEWTPAGPMQRLAGAVVANIALAVGFALLLSAAVVLRGSRVDWRHGVGWGCAGYAVFFIAPSLGLPPELPGIAAGPVAARQAWWLAAAASTAAGLWLLATTRQWPTSIGACALMVLPHLLGAPMPPPAGAEGPPRELAASFVAATAVANALFWLVLGVLTCFFHGRDRG